MWFGLEPKLTREQLRKRTPAGLAKYPRRQLAAARRSGDTRRIAAAEAEVAAIRGAVAARRTAGGPASGVGQVTGQSDAGSANPTSKGL